MVFDCRRVVVGVRDDAAVADVGDGDGEGMEEVTRC